MDWMSPFRFDPQSLYDSGVDAVLMYVFIIVAVRVAGVRSVSRMNNFDWVVTVALGGVVASTIMYRDLTIIQGAMVITLLLAMQWILTKLTRRYDGFEDLIKTDPYVLVEDGQFITETMRAHRLTQGEVMSAVREAGHEDIEGVRRVVLEPDASLSVITDDG